MSMDLKKALIDKAFNDYKSVTNMTFKQVWRWTGNPCSRVAKDRSSVRESLSLLKKPFKEWTMLDVRKARKLVALIKRWRKAKAGKPVKGCKFSKKTIVLMNHGFNPNKK